MSVLEDIQSLEMNQQVIELANIFVRERALPMTSVEDAVHIAVATVHEMDYLLTWDCKHIANAEIRKAITQPLCTKVHRLPPGLKVRNHSRIMFPVSILDG